MLNLRILKIKINIRNYKITTFIRKYIFHQAYRQFYANNSSSSFNNDKKSEDPFKRKNTQYFNGLFLPSIVLFLTTIAFYSYYYVSKIKSENPDEPSKEIKKRIIVRASRLHMKLLHFVVDLEFKPISQFLIKTYKYIFGISLEKCKNKQTTQYKSLNDFFRREPENICITCLDDHTLVSPCESEVCKFGKIIDDDKYGLVFDMQGISPKFILKNFLNVEDSEFPSKEHSCLYYVVFYLSPSNIHWFYAPVDFENTTFSEYHGIDQILKLDKIKSLKKIEKKLCKGHRIVLGGTWKMGRLFYSSVGAINVSSIYLSKYNQIFPNKLMDEYNQTNHSHHSYTRGEKMGCFNLGSTVVLVFEAPSSFQFSIKENQTLEIGQKIGSC